jgi:large subunit ribosomal protein L24
MATKQRNKANQPVNRSKMHVKTGDTVQVIAGKDKGKVGEIVQTLPKRSAVIIKGKYQD